MKTPRKQKHPKLPNGFGSIRWLGSGRSRPYAVHPPSQVKPNGNTTMPRPLCYVDDWYKGLAVLTAYHAGTYKPGMEEGFVLSDNFNVETIGNQLIRAYSITSRLNRQQEEEKPSFATIYHRFYEWKYEQDKSRKYSESAKNCTRAAFRNCSQIHRKPFSELRHQDLQSVIDDCPLKHASKELIVSLFHQMYAYADIYELVEKDYSKHVRINSEDDDEHGVPFSDNELVSLWQNKKDDVVQSILIMCYSGFRITEYKTLSVDLKGKYFQGGIKTAAGKGRIVPIHSGILSIVKNRIKKYGCLLPESTDSYRVKMYDTLDRIGIERHTPHDCRHTFSMLCEKYKVSDADRKRMMGHSFGKDITNGIYGHRDVEDLRAEIEKIVIF